MPGGKSVHGAQDLECLFVSCSLIVGLTNASKKAHICRATLEAVCFMSKEVLQQVLLGHSFSIMISLIADS